MPLIEELPVTGPTRVSHGWAYVPDTGPISAMAPPGSRKRNRNDAGTTNATATAKQQKAVQQRLESLDKENYKDNVSIPIPARTGANARDSKPGRKTTSNVRRILTYQRTFQHYLADEEAGISGSATSAQAPSSSLQRADSRRKSGITSESTPNRPSGRGRRKESDIDTTTNTPPSAGTGKEAGTMRPPGRRPGRPRRSSLKQEDTTMSDATNPTPQPAPQQQQPQPTTQPTPPPPPSPIPRPTYDPSHDTNPLLRTLNLPPMPSDKVMQHLLSEPPLSYTAARAKPLPLGPSLPTDSRAEKSTSNAILTAKPARHFCALCGYWGKVKCRKCGEWTCGLMECWKGHEGVCVALGMY